VVLEHALIAFLKDHLADYKAGNTMARRGTL
jgi:hypothetical protein